MFHGTKIWGDKFLWHGTDVNSAKIIRDQGLDMTKSHGGYFGKGFYTAVDRDHALSSYAGWAFDEEGEERLPGALIKIKVMPDARILDLRNEADWLYYFPLSKQIYRPDFWQIALRYGIDGLYDNSFEGVVFYNPDAVRIADIEEL